MKNFREEFDIKPKIIDYGNDTINVKYREIENENKMYSNMTDRNKKKKNKE